MLPDSYPRAAAPDNGDTSPEVDTADDLADAHHAIDYFSNWVKNADTKAGLLSAVLAVVIAGGAQQADAIGDITRPNGPGEMAALVVMCLLGAALVVGILALAMVVTPRTPPPQAPSRFGFPTVASHAWRGERVSRDEAASEAWGQARVLAQIAARKFVTLRVASVAVFSALWLVTAWIVTTSLLH